MTANPRMAHLREVSRQAIEWVRAQPDYSAPPEPTAARGSFAIYVALVFHVEHPNGGA